MSFTITTDIFCDGEACGDWTSGDSGRIILKKNAEEIAKSRGWIKKGRKHLCPICAGIAKYKQGGTYYDKDWKKICEE